MLGYNLTKSNLVLNIILHMVKHLARLSLSLLSLAIKESAELKTGKILGVFFVRDAQIVDVLDFVILNVLFLLHI